MEKSPILFRLPDLNDRYVIVAETDQHIESPRFGFSGRLSHIRSEELLNDIVRRGGDLVELKPVNPAAKPSKTSATTPVPVEEGRKGEGK